MATPPFSNAGSTGNIPEAIGIRLTEEMGRLGHFVNSLEESLQAMKGASLDDINKTLKTITNQVMGRVSSSTLSPKVFKKLDQFAQAFQSGNKSTFKEFSGYLNTINVQMKDTLKQLNIDLSKARSQKEQARIQGEISALENRLNKVNQALSTTTKQWDTFNEHQKTISRMQAQYERATQQDKDTFSKLSIFGKTKWGYSQINEKKLYNQFLSLYKEEYDKSPVKGIEGRMGARFAASQRMSQMGLPSAQFLDPNYQGPGGGASFRSLLSSFIDELITKFKSSTLGQKLNNVASEATTLALLKFAQGMPSWVQKAVLLAIYTGIPQVVGPLLLKYSGRLIGELAKSVIGPLLSRVGLGQLLARTGASALPLVARATPALAGLTTGIMTANWLGGLGEGAIDRTSMNNASKSGAKAGMWGGIAGAGILAAFAAPLLAVFSPWVAGFALLAGIGVAIVGIFNVIKNLFNWAKEKDESPSWLDKLTSWWSDHMPSWLGGNGGGGGSAPNITTGENVYSWWDKILGGKGSIEKTHFGGKIIDTHTMSKPRLEEYLATNLAYESLTTGGAIVDGKQGWKIDPNSFINDVPYLPTGSKNVLDAFVQKYPQWAGKLILTSALGSASSPHAQGRNSHYFGGGKFDLSFANFKPEEVKQLMQDMKASGFFSIISNEIDHGDFKIREELLRAQSDQHKKNLETAQKAVQPNPAISQYTPLTSSFKSTDISGTNRATRLHNVSVEGQR